MISGLRTLVAVFLIWTFAAPAGADWSADDLARRLKTRTVETVRYTERRDISYLSQPLVSEGTMHLKDGVLTKKVTSPDPEVFEIRDDQIIGGQGGHGEREWRNRKRGEAEKGAHDPISLS